jgi:hypothetical protein
VAVDNIKYAGLSGQVDVILGAALDVLPKLAKEIEEGTRQKFDFVFIDADWDEQWDYFDWAAKMMNKGSCIYVDNVVRQLLESGVTNDGTEEFEPIRNEGTCGESGKGRQGGCCGDADRGCEKLRWILDGGRKVKDFTCQDEMSLAKGLGMADALKPMVSRSV